MLLVSVTTQGVAVLMALSAQGKEHVPVMDVSAMWNQPRTWHTSMEMPVHANAHRLPTV